MTFNVNNSQVLMAIRSIIQPDRPDPSGNSLCESSEGHTDLSNLLEKILEANANDLQSRLKKQLELVPTEIRLLI